MGTIVAKGNALVTASHRLDEAEQRLLLLGIAQGRKSCMSIAEMQHKEITIHASDYVDMFGVDRTTAYRVLKKAVIGLFRSEWGYRYINDKGLLQVAYRRFIQAADYVDNGGYIVMKFSDDIIPLLVELEKNFTLYEIEQIANLSSRYSMRLFEILMQFFDKKTGKGWLDISLDDVRFQFGLLPSEYQQMSNFKKFVLDFSIQQINENTDYTVTYTQKKQGRKIAGFRFDMVAKKKMGAKQKNDNQRDSNTIDMIDGLTDKEREIVAQKNSYADSINATEQHRKNLVNKAIKEHREAQAEAETQAQERTQKQAEAQKQAQNELERAKSLYQQLIDADDATIAQFVADNKELIMCAGGAEKHYYQNNDFRGVVSAMRHRFENAVMFRTVNVSAIK